MTSDDGDGPLRLSAVRFGYPRRPTFLGPIDFTLDTPGLVAVVGPNGAGKSTLLRLIAGLLTPSAGRVTVHGRRVHELRGRDRAGLIAFVPQRPEAPTDLTAREVVLLGRYPHRRHALFETSEDHRAAEEALRTTDASAFADRSLDTLSGGEQQRIHLAAAVAQDTRLLVLDEPTSALDPYHQLSIFGVLRRLGEGAGVTAVVATHDLNLAGQFADTVVLLSRGKIVRCDTPREVLRPESLEEVYRVPFRAIASEDASRPWVLPVIQAGAAIR